MVLVDRRRIAMEWIFVVSSIGLLVLIAAQVLEYAVELRRSRRALPRFRDVAWDVPPGGAQPRAHIAALYDQAA
jgi:hypothetical protein